jgi:hypothetical protein
MCRHIRRFLELQYFFGEYVIGMLISNSGPGKCWRLFFRSPVVLYRCGSHHLVSKQVLLLTTIGRKTSTPRTTPVGYTFDPATNTYYIVVLTSGDKQEELRRSRLVESWQQLTCRHYGN